MSLKILYSVQDLRQLISSRRVCLVDVRDAEFYRDEHIAGAVNIPEIFYFLSESTEEGLKRLQSTFQVAFSQAGITHDKTLIFYEDSLTKRYCGSCRGYWLASYLGHEKTGILYGGLDAWKKEGLPLETGEVSPRPTRFEVRLKPHLLVTLEDVKGALDDPAVILLDDRDEDEWHSESSSPYGPDFAPRKGRIPGAKWIEWRRFMDDSGDFPDFKSPEEVRAMCREQGILPDSDIIIYCFKGSRASNTYVALKRAGFQHVRVYFASWNEWARHPELPIETE